LNEISRPNAEPPIKGTRVWIRLAVVPTYQLTRRLAIETATSLVVTLVDTAFHDTETTINTSAGLLFALKHWDVYAYAGLGDVGGVRLPTLGAGVVLRWATEN
jgi:hypothetical protein